MNIQWYGHSCFLLSNQNNKRLLFDPYNEKVGYRVMPIEADIVLASHGHYDHNDFTRVTGNPVRCTEPGKYHYGDYSILGLPSYHDEEQGAKRGPNILFVVECDGLRICHCGDLGHLLSDELVSQLQNIDVLLIPVGGFYTIDAETAKMVAEQIGPKTIIPMHYSLPGCQLPISGVEPFLSLFDARGIYHAKGPSLSLPFEGGQQVVVMEPAVSLFPG